MIYNVEIQRLFAVHPFLGHEKLQLLLLLCSPAFGNASTAARKANCTQERGAEYKSTSI